MIPCKHPGVVKPRGRGPNLHLRRVALELRLPARRPVQQGGRGLLVRGPQGRLAREGELLEHRVHAHRHRTAQQRPRTRVLQHGDRRRPRRPRDREVDLQARHPHDNAVAESTNHVLKRELVSGRAFWSEEELSTAPFGWVNRCNNFRIHSTLGYTSLVDVAAARRQQAAEEPADTQLPVHHRHGQQVRKLLRRVQGERDEAQQGTEGGYKEEAEGHLRVHAGRSPVHDLGRDANNQEDEGAPSALMGMPKITGRHCWQNH